MTEENEVDTQVIDKMIDQYLKEANLERTGEDMKRDSKAITECKSDTQSCFNRLNAEIGSIVGPYNPTEPRPSKPQSVFDKYLAAIMKEKES